MHGTCKGPGWLGEGLQSRFENMAKRVFLGEFDMVRRVDPNGEALVWCRNCLCYARCRLGPKLMNRCRPEKKHGRARENVEKNPQSTKKRCAGHKSRTWKVEGERRSHKERSASGLRKSLKTEVFMTREGLWYIAKKENFVIMLQERECFSEWRSVKEYQPLTWCEYCWARIFS